MTERGFMRNEENGTHRAKCYADSFDESETISSKQKFRMGNPNTHTIQTFTVAIYRYSTHPHAFKYIVMAQTKEFIANVSNIDKENQMKRLLTFLLVVFAFLLFLLLLFLLVLIIILRFSCCFVFGLCSIECS